MRIVSVVGARPQFVKLAPIAHAMRGLADHVIIHTGQHYDDLMSDVFFRDLGIPQPDLNLGVGSASHGAQTAMMLTSLEEAFTQLGPDQVLVYGDTNSTLAAAIAAAKMHIPLSHLEAGLRSFNRRMPEEHNRVLTDHSSDLLLAPTAVAMGHLADEGLAERSLLVGDVMTDVLYRVRDQVLAAGLVGLEGLENGQYRIATIHRPDNSDDPARLGAILDALAHLDLPVVLLAHPRIVALAERHGLSLTRGSLIAREPLPYPALIGAVMGSAGVVTDSGGLQKEAFLLRVPTTTIRPETEWVETLEGGWNVLANDVAVLPEIIQRATPQPTDASPYGDGRAAERAVEAMLALTPDSSGPATS